MALSPEAIQGLLAFGLGTLGNNTGNYGLFGPAVGKGGLLGMQAYGNAKQQSLDTRRQEQDERFRTFQMENATIAQKLQFQKMQQEADNQRRIQEQLGAILGPQSARTNAQPIQSQVFPNGQQDAPEVRPYNPGMQAPQVGVQGAPLMDPERLARGGLSMAGLDPQVASTLMSGANFFQGAQQKSEEAKRKDDEFARGKMTPVTGLPGIFVNNDNEKYYKWVRDSKGSLVEQELNTDELTALDLASGRARAPRVSMTQTQETEEAKKVGGASGEEYAAIQKAALETPKTIARYSQLETLLDGVNTGKLTPLGTELAAYAASLGLNVDKNLGNKQAAVALASQMALELRNPSGGAGMPGALSDRDREFLVRMIPNLSTSPDGIKQMVGFAKKMAERNAEVAKLARQYRSKHGSFDYGFVDELEAAFKDKHLFGKPAPIRFEDYPE